MDKADDSMSRAIAALAHHTVPRSFLKAWLIEQERRATRPHGPDWQYPLPRPQHYVRFSKRTRRFSIFTGA